MKKDDWFSRLTWFVLRQVLSAYLVVLPLSFLAQIDLQQIAAAPFWGKGCHCRTYSWPQPKPAIDAGADQAGDTMPLTPP